MESQNQETLNTCPAPALSWMPDGNGGWMPTPDLLSEAEAVRFLRIDLIKIKNPDCTLRRYRKEYGLQTVQISKQVLFPRCELEKLIKKLMEVNPR